MIDTKTVYSVHSNTDLTEGRGREVLIAVCEKQATAVRLAKGKGVQGTNAYVTTSPAYRIKNDEGQSPWLHSFNLIAPTAEDLKNQKIIEEDEALIARALELGLTKDEIKKLTRGTI